MDKSRESEPAPDAAPEVPYATHRWNFWVCGSEAALYMTAISMMGPMALFPFLFNQTGISSSFLGLFTASNLIMSLGGPFGSALAGSRRWKLPFCIRAGLVQRLPFLLVPLGVALLADRPGALLCLLVLGWTASNFLTGVNAPVYQTVLTNSVREGWWGRMTALRNLLGAVAGLLATVLVWVINRHLSFPHNYTLLGAAGVVLLMMSLYVSSRIREVPGDETPADRPTLKDEAARMVALLRGDGRVRWLVYAYAARSCGFFLGTYCTAVFIERCHLTDHDMWLPVILGSVPNIAAYSVAGWMVDRYGPKPALVLSAILVGVNSIFVMYCYTLWSFLLFFPSIAFGGSLLTSAWPTLLMKMAPAKQRPLYYSTISLAVAPGSIVVSLIGVCIVQFLGYDTAFTISATGGFLASWLFYRKLENIPNPNLRQRTRIR